MRSLEKSILKSWPNSENTKEKHVNHTSWKFFKTLSSGTKKPNWVVIDEPVEPVGDEITQDREMQVDDECFGVKVGSLKGEAKGLIDFTHKTSQTELVGFSPEK